jgi:hypothetical protein
MVPKTYPDLGLGNFSCVPPGKVWSEPRALKSPGVPREGVFRGFQPANRRFFSLEHDTANVVFGTVGHFWFQRIQNFHVCATKRTMMPHADASFSSNSGVKKSSNSGVKSSTRMLVGTVGHFWFHLACGCDFSPNQRMKIMVRQIQT